MKTIIQIFYLLPAVFTVTLMSCQKESIEPIMELTIDGMQKVITVEKNGVGIEFCLLNEKGEPATVFQEGENFKFHLAIINNVEPDTAMYIVSDFFTNQEIFKVYDINENVIGRPWEEKMVIERSDATNQIDAGEKWIMESPWTETRIFTGFYEPDVIRFLQFFFFRSQYESFTCREILHGIFPAVLSW